MVASWRKKLYLNRGIDFDIHFFITAVVSDSPFDQIDLIAGDTGLPGCGQKFWKAALSSLIGP